MRSRFFVVNASPLIMLGRLARLELLPALADEVLVPKGVFAEVAARADEDWVARMVAEQPGLLVVPDVDQPASLSRSNLGSGERCVIAQGRQAWRTRHPGRCAGQESGGGVRCPFHRHPGPAGACQESRTDLPREAIVSAMRDLGFYASDVLIQELLRSVGELPGDAS